MTEKRPDDTGFTIADGESPIRREIEVPTRRRFVEPTIPAPKAIPAPPPGRMTRLAPGCSRAH
jgi:hypothetical protein